MHSTLYSERRNGIKLLATYLQEIPGHGEQPEQVAALIRDALRERSDLVQEQTLELLLDNFTRIKFIPEYLLSPLLDLFKNKKPAHHTLVRNILVKILETSGYPALNLIEKFFGTPTKGQKMTPENVVDLLQVLCKVFPIHGDTKQLFYNLLFDPNAVPVRVPDKCETKFQQIVGTHLWGLEHQRKVRLVDVAQTGITFPIEGELLSQFREFTAALIKASTKSALTPETVESILKRFPPFPLDRCFAPFFFIDVTSVTKRHVITDLHEIEIDGTMKCLLPVSFTLIGIEGATASPTGLESTVHPNGDFHLLIQIKKIYQNYIPLMFYVDVMSRQVPILMPFVMPQRGDSILHGDAFALDEKTMPVPLTTGGGEYLRATCLNCGEQNAFRISEITNHAPLYCRSCGVLMKRPGEMHLI